MMLSLQLLTLTALLMVAAGCRSTRDSGEKRDPLMGRYIPKTDLPVPGRDVAGRKDPLLTQPAKGNGRTTAVEKDTFRNTAETSIAGLAQYPRVQNSGMSIDDRRPAAEPVRRGTPLTRDPSRREVSLDYRRAEFERLQARLEKPIQDSNGEYVVGAQVTLNADGAKRRYEGRGATLNAALNELRTAIESDSKER